MISLYDTLTGDSSIVYARDSEAERIGERMQSIRARPWPERPVSAADKSGNDTAAPRPTLTYPRGPMAAQ